MSLRTLESRFARSRVLEIWDFRRRSSVPCCSKISRCRARLVDFRADALASLSRRRVSWESRAERWLGISSS